MFNDTSVVHSPECKCKCLAWKPITAGALVAIGLTFLLNLFMVAIGVTAFSTDSEGVEKLAFSGLVATSLGVIVCMFAAGWITGYLSKNHCSKHHLGALYGFLAWIIALIITIFLATHAQEYVTFYGHFLSGSTQTLQASVGNGAAVASIATHLSPQALVISTYVIFVLFFLSAFSCSLGGHCGMRHKCKQEKSTSN